LKTDILGKKTDILGKKTDILGKKTDILGKRKRVFDKNYLFLYNTDKKIILSEKNKK